MNKHKDNDWEKLLSSLTKENEEQSMSKPSGIINGIFALALINGLSALFLMLANKIINSAWEGLTVFTPAIGYADAYWLCGILWIIFFIKTAIINSMKGNQ